MLTGDPEPTLLADLDQHRVGAARALQAMEAQLKSQNARTVNWNIAAYPTAGQAEQMFGEPDVDRLWDAVAASVRLDEDDPVAAWRAHTEKLQARCRQLDEAAFDAIQLPRAGHRPHRRAPPRRALERRRRSRPSTASSTSPTCRPRRCSSHPTGAARRARSGRRGRSSLGGTIVEDLAMRFEAGQGGRGDRQTASKRSRRRWTATTFGRALGEVALVDGESRVGKTGLTFFDTLFDENATCHIAYGAAVTFGIDGIDGPVARTSSANVGSTSPRCTPTS